MMGGQEVSTSSTRVVGISRHAVIETLLISGILSATDMYGRIGTLGQDATTSFRSRDQFHARTRVRDGNIDFALSPENIVTSDGTVQCFKTKGLGTVALGWGFAWRLVCRSNLAIIEPHLWPSDF
jgi:hypothetical protein